ncbi:MAG: hypothetical protein QNL04_11565 [SAR324 cluster bacterium]|nr:hypothetical protein [SAR324 cluster bacterium]
MEFGIADVMFAVAFLVLGLKTWQTVKTLNRRTFQDPHLNPLQKDEEEVAVDKEKTIESPSVAKPEDEKA